MHVRAVRPGAKVVVDRGVVATECRSIISRLRLARGEQVARLGVDEDVRGAHLRPLLLADVGRFGFGAGR